MHIANPLKLTLQPKLCKEFVCPNARGTAKLIANLLRMNKSLLVARYLKHLADSADSKGVTLNKHLNGLIGNRFEMPNDSYTQPLRHILGSTI